MCLSRFFLIFWGTIPPPPFGGKTILAGGKTNMAGGKNILEGGKIILAGGKIIWAGGKFILACGKIVLAGGRENNFGRWINYFVKRVGQLF